MHHSVKDILENLDSPPFFRYVKGGRLSRESPQFIHQMGKGIKSAKILKWMSPSMKELFKQFNGVNLFRPKENANAGFVFFDSEEIEQEKKDFQDNFRDCCERNEYDNDEKEWLLGLIPIAAPFYSGDRYVADTFHRAPDGEYRILFLRHELISGEALFSSDVDEIASSYVDFFMQVLIDPLQYITRDWFDNVSHKYCQIKSVNTELQVSTKTDFKNDVPRVLTLDIVETKLAIDYCVEKSKVTLTVLAKKMQGFEQADRVMCLIAPLLKGRLSIVRVLAPKGSRFCDVSIYWPWINSILLWAKTFSVADKKLIRQEQKASGWKSDDIYHDGPSFALRGQYMDFCVCSTDVDIAIEYVELQMRSFLQPFMLDDVWEFEYTNMKGSEGELAKLVGDFEPFPNNARLEQLMSVCLDLENHIPHPIQTNVRTRLGLIGIYSVGPDCATNQVFPIHVLRARMLRLLGWPRTIVLARAALHANCDAEIMRSEGEMISWRSELLSFIDETLRKYPVIDQIYTPIGE